MSFVHLSCYLLLFRHLVCLRNRPMPSLSSVESVDMLIALSPYWYELRRHVSRMQGYDGTCLVFFKAAPPTSCVGCHGPNNACRTLCRAVSRVGAQCPDADGSSY